MFINLSNHTSKNWSEAQINEARRYGILTDLAFPAIDPKCDPNEIASLADSYVDKIKTLLAEADESFHAVHIMGEVTFCFALVARLQKDGITCLASTTIRQTVDYPDGSKTSKFGFVRFREYILIA